MPEVNQQPLGKPEDSPDLQPPTPAIVEEKEEPITLQQVIDDLQELFVVPVERRNHYGLKVMGTAELAVWSFNPNNIVARFFFANGKRDDYYLIYDGKFREAILYNGRENLKEFIRRHGRR